MKLSVVIPAYNEEGCIDETIQSLYSALKSHQIDHEIFVTNDNSTDGTLQKLEQICTSVPTLQFETNKGPNGFGYAVRYGLERCTGGCIAIFMADLSDDPNDLVRFYNTMITERVDCVFGTRWSMGGTTHDYPTVKRILNRIANTIIMIALGIRYNDVTNAFKLYKRETIQGLKPFLSPHFNLTLELPGKAIVRGYTYAVIPNTWRNRKHGTSKLKIKEMGSRYFFILMYCLIERYFAKGDFKKKR